MLTTPDTPAGHVFGIGSLTRSANGSIRSERGRRLHQEPFEERGNGNQSKHANRDCRDQNLTFHNGRSFRNRTEVTKALTIRTWVH
jgi:hypothetical protein